MSDLVERLRKFCYEWGKMRHTGDDIQGIHCGEGREAVLRASDLTEAADTIEQLRADKRELMEALGDLVSWFDDGPSSYGPWIIKAGEFGADDAANAARATLAKIISQHAK